ncbi:MAG: hypothetical protein OEV93_01555 [Candidatus Moranbacteria bacterium]|nr:hypothetical protein [Candidatus Moranbacteria bacterium]
MNRDFKRIIIILIYLFILGVIVGGLYSIFKEKPTCFDGILNQNEQKIDCGGVCAPCEKEIVVSDIEIVSADIIDGGNGKIDILVKLRNPNNNFGSSGFRYNIALKDANNDTLEERSGKSYILPMETKYVIETNFEPNKRPSEVIVQLSGNNWKELNIFEEPELNIFNKEYYPVNDNEKSAVYGLLKNESRFDFGEIDLNVILRDSKGKPVAVNKTVISNLFAQQERDFKLIWPYNLGLDVMEVEIEAETNVFDSQNYVKEYQTGQKFQEF